MKEEGLPAELELVIFDLWALRVAQLSDRIASSSQETESQSVFSTLDTDDDDGTDRSYGKSSTTSSRKHKLSSAPNLHDCLALCYLGICTLRLPVTPGDIYTWVLGGKMAYMGAIKLLPLPMRDRLPGTYHSVLNPPSMLTHKQLYTSLSSLQRQFEKEHKILWPPLNVPLLLFRYLRELALPLEVYDATMHLGDLLGYDFASHHPSGQQLKVRYLAEAHLVGCLVVCVKLLYPLDKVIRYPKSSSEPMATSMDWKFWCRAAKDGRMDQRKRDSQLTSEEMTRFEEKDVFDLLPEQLDQYLDFYADSFLDPLEIQRLRGTSDFHNTLYNMFPIEGEESQRQGQPSNELHEIEEFDMVKAVHHLMRPNSFQAHDDQSVFTKPGQQYPIWKHEEEVPERARIFYEAVGKIAGFSMEQMVSAVSATEVKINKYWLAAQRRQRKAEP